jgi:signal peptidase II
MRYVVLLVSIVCLDQFLKWYMSGLLPLCVAGYCNTIEILPVFRLALLHNSGAAFSFLSDAGGWQRWFLVTVSTIVSIFIGVWLYRSMHTEKLLSLGLAFVLGGAIGNLIDRVLDGYVVDFIVVHWQEYNFPAFNIADSAIFIGACILLLEMFLKPEESGEASDSDA